MSEREDPEADAAESGNYEGVSGGGTTPQSGDPDAEAAQQGAQGGDDGEDADTAVEYD